MTSPDPRGRFLYEIRNENGDRRLVLVDKPSIRLAKDAALDEGLITFTRHMAYDLLGTVTEVQPSLEPLTSFAQWIVALDEPEATERRTVTLTQIIEAARAALSEPPEERDG